MKVHHEAESLKPEQSLITIGISVVSKIQVVKMTFQGLVSTWQEYRVPFLLAQLALLGIVLSIRFVQYRSIQRSKALQASSVRSPILVSKDKNWQEGDNDRSPDPAFREIVKEIDQNESSLQAKVASSQKRIPKRITGAKVTKNLGTEAAGNRKILPVVFFSSLTGSSERYARTLANDIRQSLHRQASNVLEPQIHDLSYIDYDDYFVTPPQPAEGIQYFYLLLVPTYNIDTVLNTFLVNLEETHHDFRIDTAPLASLAGYSVFGFGDKEGWKTEEQGFCSQAIEIDRWMAKLTDRKRAFPIGLGDVKSDVQSQLEAWLHGVESVMIDLSINGNLGEGVLGSGDSVESDEEDVDTPGADSAARKPRKSTKRKPNTTTLGDLEDLGNKNGPGTGSDADRTRLSTPIPVDFTSSKNTLTAPQPLKEMVPASSPTFTALTKQGYAIIGSHSGVKICRWTKSALRGRGSCYKYSFYGIKSHLCMETTPSLSCSNKCVFCWRHGTNPVGTTWRWQVDPPELIFSGAKEAHLKKIKMMRGVPGVRAERFQEAMRIRHCALSLVGEPIFYPHINEFVQLLHADKISSFLVCNAQHPEQLESLKVVTQLYVSIDASNRESLRKVDRPLHRDFWERFMRCLDIIREKRFRMRTVYRLTLVKGFNIDDEAEGYAELVARGLPCFVEVKGVTYCGTSSSAGAGLTMQNVPFYEEVTSFVEALNSALGRRGLDYGIAAEHAHSCCVLLASKRFLVDGRWHTLIDYEKFFECLGSGKEFAPEDYMGPPTPEWATWGHGGFDPADERVYRKAKKVAQEVPRITDGEDKA
ncbi:MAG: hypothetical protein Q9195_001524 [Heterodermia aff. obscurata]